MTTAFVSIFGAFAMLTLLACGLALLPALLVVAAFVLAFSLIAGVIGLVVRIVGALLLLMLAVPLGLAMIGITFAVGIAVLHAAMPLLILAGIVWLIVHHGRKPLPPAQRAI